VSVETLKIQLKGFWGRRGSWKLLIYF